MPVDFLTSPDSFTMSKPFTHALPEVCFRMVHSIGIRVVFPALSGPGRPNIPLYSTSRSRLSKDVILPYFIVRASVLMTTGSWLELP